MPTFPVKSTIATQFYIEKVYAESYFYGFLHEGIDKKNDSPIRLIVLPSHISRIENLKAFSDSTIFLPMQFGEEGYMKYFVTPAANLISYSHYITALKPESRKFDLFFLKIIEKLHYLHTQANIILPYFNPDLIFIDMAYQEEIRLLGPFSFDRNKIDPAIEGCLRFIAPGYLTSYQKQYFASQDYYSVLIMLIEALLGQPIIWDFNSYHIQLDIKKIPIAYQEILSWVKDIRTFPTNEEEVYNKLSSFFKKRLEWQLEFCLTPNIFQRNIHFIVNGMTINFSKIFQLEYNSKNVLFEFPEEIQDANENSCFYRLEKIHTVPDNSFLHHKKNQLELIDALQISTQPKIFLEYQHTTKLNICWVGKAQPKVRVNGKENFQQISENDISFSVPTEIPLAISVNLPTNFEIDLWKIDGIEKTDWAGHPSIEIGCLSKDCNLLFHTRQLKNPLKLWGGIIGAIVLIGLAIVSVFLWNPFVVNVNTPINLTQKEEETIPKGLEKLQINSSGFMEYRRIKDNMIMIEIPATVVTLNFGNQTSEYIIQKFWIDKYEVSMEQFVKFLNETTPQLALGEKILQKECADIAKNCGLSFDGMQYSCLKTPNAIHKLVPNPKQPMTNISTQQMQEYANWIGGDIPIEYEWVLAASWNINQQKQTKYPWGDLPATKNEPLKFNFNKILQPADSHPQGISHYGLYNMSGNASEVCYKSNSKEFSLCGGSYEWNDDKSISIAMTRPVSDKKSFRRNDVGFRCVIRSK